MASGMTPEQQAYYDSIPNGTQITPEMARRLGWVEERPGLWRTQSGHFAGAPIGHGPNAGLPKKGRFDVKGILRDTAISFAAPLAVNAILGAAAPSAASTATPTLGNIGATGSLPASVTGSAGATLTAPGAVAGAAVPTVGASVGTGVGFGTGGAAVPTAGSTVGPGVGFGAGGVPVSSTLGTTTMATAAPAAAGFIDPNAVANGNFFKKALFSLGADAAKTFFSGRASSQANKELQKGGDAAIATYKEAFDPYMKLGANAANAQNYLMGFGPLGAFGGGQVPVSPNAPPQTTGRTAPEGAPSLGNAIPRTSAMVDPQGMGSLGAFGRRAAQQSQSSFIKMRAPDGEVGDVHPSQLQAALAAGAQELG